MLSQWALCLPKNDDSAGREPLFIAFVNQQRSAQISRRKSDTNVNLYTSAAQRVQAKTVVFFLNSMFGLLCKPTKIITVLKFRLAKTPTSYPIQVGKLLNSILKIEYESSSYVDPDGGVVSRASQQ